VLQISHLPRRALFAADKGDIIPLFLHRVFKALQNAGKIIIGKPAAIVVRKQDAKVAGSAGF
jgi:hypothetical protein